MIIRNGVQPKAFYKGDNPIKGIYRGEDLVWRKARLPDAYREVEYIESDGGYVNLGFTESFQSHTVVRLFLPSEISVGSYIIGKAGTRANLRIIASTQQLRVNFNSTTDAATFINFAYAPIGEEFVVEYWFDIGNREIKARMNDNPIISALFNPLTITDDYTIRHFILSTGTGYKNIRILEYLHESNEGNHHLIPCYRKSDNAIGEYDLTNDVFISGTGALLAGPDVN